VTSPGQEPTPATAPAGYWPFHEPPVPISQFAAWRMVMGWWFARWWHWTDEEIDRHWVWRLDEWS
jgi:hypothetical protein